MNIKELLEYSDKVQIVVSIADLKEFALEISNEVLSKYIESTKKRYYGW